MVWQGKTTDKKHIPYVRVKDLEEFIRCANDPWYFIMTYVKIIHPLLGKVPFELYGFQKSVLWCYLKHQYCISLKPRQMGMTTLVCGYVLWLCLFHSYKKCLLVSIKQTVSNAMLKKVKEMWKDLPDFLKVEVVNGTWDDPGTSSKMMFANGSEIEAVPATEDAGRSEAVSCLVMDEVAFQRYASTIWGSAGPTLSTGGQAILLSTAFGMGNFFYETWTGAVSRANDFYPIHLNWQMHPERTLNWYTTQRRLLGDKRTAQEIDCDFLQSGFTVFDMAKIRAIEDRLNNTNFTYDEQDRLKIVAAYDNTKQYTIGADIATGRGRDYSAFSIWDQFGKTYASFKGKVGIGPYAHMLMKWGQRYGMANLAPEVNAIGEGVLSVLQEHGYPNIHKFQATAKKADEYRIEESDIYGWLTTGKTRNEVIAEMDDDLDEDAVEINNPYFVQEAYTFVYSQVTNKPIAAGKEAKRGSVDAMYEDESKGAGFTDDAIVADCIGNRVRKKVIYTGMMPILGGR